MKVAFWLLDITHEVKEDMSEVWLWGVDDSEKRVLIIDRNFLSYFYAVIEEHANPTKIIEDIEKEHLSSVVKLEVVERKFFGKPVKAIKIYCKNPNDIAKYAQTLRKFEGIKDCFEDDIRHVMRYLIDNNVVPCCWHEAEVSEETNTRNVQVDKIYNTKSPPKIIEKTKAPQLRILGFSTICYSREGSPKPDRKPVIIISTLTNQGEEKQFVANEDKNDKLILESFTNYVQNFDPDIMVGYNTNDQDWPYFNGRCKKLGLRLNVDRARTELHTSVYGHVSITGRINIDLFDFADEFPEIKSKTLENLADYLGVMKIENRTLIDDVDFADYWDEKDKREHLKKFSLENAHCVMGIAEAIRDFAMQLSSLVGLPLDHVGSAAVGFRVEWFLMKHALKRGEIIPKRIEQPYRPYAGAIVLKPEPGLHENIAVLDFKSMYPNLMIAYNLSPDTYVSPEHPAPVCGVYETPEVKHKFKKEPAGFYKEALSYLIKTRDEIRSKMQTLSPESIEYRVLDARQKAVKVITNASYGYAGWTGARWYLKPVAEAAAAWGRYSTLEAIKMAEKTGLKVVYGDTDSIFVKYEKEKTGKLSKEIEEKLGLEIKPGQVYTRIFFTEAKKRYAGLLPDGHLDIVGLEVIRGDWAAIARKVQEKVLETILKEKAPKKAVKWVQHFISEMRQKKIPYKDLIIWKTLTKPVEEYEIKASHVEIAKMLMERGWKLTAGDKIGYVVVIGTGHLYERVKPYMFASYGEIDTEYYVFKQIIPVAARILEGFGVTEEQLLTPKIEETEKKLADFLGS